MLNRLQLNTDSISVDSPTSVRCHVDVDSTSSTHSEEKDLIVSNQTASSKHQHQILDDINVANQSFNPTNNYLESVYDISVSNQNATSASQLQEPGDYVNLSHQNFTSTYEREVAVDEITVVSNQDFASTNEPETLVSSMISTLSDNIVSNQNITTTREYQATVDNVTINNQNITTTREYQVTVDHVTISNQKNIMNDSGFLIDPDMSINDTFMVENSNGNGNVPSTSNDNSTVNSARILNDGQESVEKKANIYSTQKKKLSVKPDRLCIFCKKLQKNGTLSRHIKFIHKNEKKVQEALMLSRKERLLKFQMFKRDGILYFNKHEAIKELPAYQRERRAKIYLETKMCGYCKKFIASRIFNKHKKNCQVNSAKKVASLPTRLLELPNDVTITEDFKTSVIGKIRNDEIGKICRKDETILKLGSIFYWKSKSKKDKIIQIRKTVRQEMRRLAGLFRIVKTKDSFHMKTCNCQDMFLRKNFPVLREAIDEYTTNVEDKIKPGLKQNISYLLKRSAKILLAITDSEGKDEDGEEIERFLRCLGLWEAVIFGDAQYELNKRRQINLRKPSSLPLEEDILKIRNYVLDTIKSMSSDPFIFWDYRAFVRLRDATLTRLTLLNARRGGEPAKLFIREWEEARDNMWIDQQRATELDEIDKLLVKSIKVTYITGKGNNHLVPLIIPEDTLASMAKLSNENIRSLSTVLNSNNYVFASTGESDEYVSGWHSLNRVCSSLILKKPENVKSTSNRHRVSTLFARLEIPQSEREYFYKHMGHSGKINQDVYQSPLALMEITKVSKHLIDFEKETKTIDKTKHGVTETSECSTSKIVGETTWENVVAGKKLIHEYDSKESDDDVNQVASDEVEKKKHKMQKKRKEVDLIEKKKPKEVETKANSKNVERKKYKMRKRKIDIEKKRSESEDTEYEDNEISTSGSLRWSERATRDFYKQFQSYIDRSSEKSMPSREEMEMFTEKHQMGVDFKKVRNKISNERVKYADRLKKLNVE